ncbi:MAG: SRPBCC family protein [Halobacteriales archaeon]
MDEFEVRTVIYLPPEDVHGILLDFERYPRYSDYLASVRADGDGGVGTEYALRFEWRMVSYVAHSRVTEVEPPNRIGFELIRGIEATGAWEIEPAPDRAPEGRAGSLVRFTARYDPDTVTSSVVDLPAFVSLSWVIDRAKPLVKREARNVVERIVADVEGERRDVEVTIRS